MAVAVVNDALVLPALTRLVSSLSDWFAAQPSPVRMLGVRWGNSYSALADQDTDEACPGVGRSGPTAAARPAMRSGRPWWCRWPMTWPWCARPSGVPSISAPVVVPAASPGVRRHRCPWRAMSPAPRSR